MSDGRNLAGERDDRGVVRCFGQVVVQRRGLEGTFDIDIEAERLFAVALLGENADDRAAAKTPDLHDVVQA